MKEFLRTKGYKMTPQREMIFRAFFELGEHVTVEELYEKVRKIDPSVGHSTVCAQFEADLRGRVGGGGQDGRWCDAV